MPMLEKLVFSAREDVEARRRELSDSDLEARLGDRPDNRPFAEALTRPGLSLIAEFKRHSPSEGEIQAEADPAAIAASYERAGAAALSVLTDRPSFGGSLDDLRAARSAGHLPVLRKDFIVDRYQLLEAAVAGADAVLLIVGAVRPRDLADLHATARSLDLDVLVEVHDEDQLEQALEAGAGIVGINNRNLEDFSVSLQTTYELMPDVPAGVTVVSESGISSRDQVAEMERIGVDAVLVGTSLMRSGDPAAMIGELIGTVEETREHRL